VADGRLGYIDGQTNIEVQEGIWRFDDDDWLLIAMLEDPIYMSELLFIDPKNREYAGCYHVMDYQYPLFRIQDNYEGHPCARSVGKTESIKARGVCHAFKRQQEDMLITAPELIHLLPLTDAIEGRIIETRLTREFLDRRNQKTGFTHKPFQCDFADGTKIVGRIPKLSGTGVKGMHEPDLIIEEAQDYPEKGWIEVHETVMKDHVDNTASRTSPTTSTASTQAHGTALLQAVAVRRVQDHADHRDHAAGLGTGREAPGRCDVRRHQAPDYRRNILGEAGGASSAFFVTARLMACLDQDRESHYNTVEWKRQQLQSEEVDDMLGTVEEGKRDEAMYDLLGSLIDLPELKSQQIFAGADIGLVNDPTVITLWSVEADKARKTRLKLVRMFHLWRFREKMIRMVTYHIGWKYGARLRGFGMDVTGLGLPIFQAMEDDEVAPQHLLDVSRGYVFNAKVPIGVDKSLVTRTAGQPARRYGNMVEEEEDPVTGRAVHRQDVDDRGVHSLPARSRGLHLHAPAVRPGDRW
jgi:hypothetical protein